MLRHLGDYVLFLPNAQLAQLIDFGVILLWTDSPLPFRDATIVLQVTGPPLLQTAGPQDSTQPSWIWSLFQ